MIGIPKEIFTPLFAMARIVGWCAHRNEEITFAGKRIIRPGYSSIAPEKPYNQYRHNGYEDNADAHLKRTVMGREVVVAVTEGKLDFGTWEQIFYFEFDGKRDKRALIKVIGIEEEEI